MATTKDDRSENDFGPIATAIRASIDSNPFNRHESMGVPYCYMCMEAMCEVDEGSPLELISPCVCHSVVHRKCLNQWRATSNTHNAMTHCPTCKEAYETTDTPQVEALKAPIFWAKVWRVAAFVALVLGGSLIVLLVDAGTPKFFNLHWNALDGEIYDWVGLPSVPRYLVYVMLSLAMTLFVMAVLWLVRWCHRNRVCRDGVDCSNVWMCNCVSCTDSCGEDMLIMIALLLVIGVFVGLVMLVMAIVGAVVNAVDGQRERRVRSLQVQQTNVRNLRSLSSV
ncbi:hypothetical protein DYB28_015079 [Aphanomyces astaci]|uniref:Uncharacterized protein n=1 Tax=Aphanomyces astaci TaxID=112090 RepID=A0A3L6UZM3_APHAT|nr:hypothetical protein DYB34_009794 [Aphanomyces astaci]RLO01849.1 hypothetical protein DYB28_015079 [Aphanomyces astaci]